MSPFRHPLKNSGRSAGTPDRPTNTEVPVPAHPTLPDVMEAADDGRLVDLAMYRALHGRALADDPPIDATARERAEQWIADFAQKVGEAEAMLAAIGGFVGEGSLGAAAVGRAGVKLGEAREQYPAMLQAVRDMERAS